MVTRNRLTCACDVIIRDQSQQAELSDPPADLQIDQEAAEAAAETAALVSEPEAGTGESGQLFIIAFACRECRS